jgi:DNA polymerase
MFVGGAPDRASDARGRPFAGESGELLTRIIEAINLRRDQVYVTTAVKCFVPQGDPDDDCVEACLPLLHRQIEIIQPEIICALGPVAARALRAPGSQTAPPRGKMYQTGPVLVMPTHHPELLLHRPELKHETWIDVQIVERRLASHTRRKQ